MTERAGPVRVVSGVPGPGVNSAAAVSPGPNSVSNTSPEGDCSHSVGLCDCRDATPVDSAGPVSSGSR